MSSATAENTTPPAWQRCFQEAGAHFRTSPELLIAIARTESALDPSAIHLNRNGTQDIGLMQINSQWLPALQQAGFAQADLYQPCTSIWIGAWILAQAVARYGYGWEAVGAYNAGYRNDAAARRHRAVYAHRVSHRLDQLRAAQCMRDAPRSSRTAEPSRTGSRRCPPDAPARPR